MTLCKLQGRPLLWKTLLTCPPGRRPSLQVCWGQHDCRGKWKILLCIWNKGVKKTVTFCDIFWNSCRGMLNNLSLKTDWEQKDSIINKKKKRTKPKPRKNSTVERFTSINQENRRKIITKSTWLHLDSYQMTEHSHLLEWGSHKATVQAQHCLCKESLCFKQNVCTVINVLPLALCHSKDTISWTVGSLWTSDSLEEEEVLPHHNHERRRGCIRWIHQESN